MADVAGSQFTCVKICLLVFSHQPTIHKIVQTKHFSSSVATQQPEQNRDQCKILWIICYILSNIGRFNTYLFVYNYKNYVKHYKGSIVYCRNDTKGLYVSLDQSEIQRTQKAASLECAEHHRGRDDDPCFTVVSLENVKMTVTVVSRPL